jgi:hypothetical protein
MKIPKTLEKLAKFAILGGALLFNPVSPAQKADADPIPYFNLSNTWAIGYGTPFMNISGIPEYMRTVPIHPDDGTGNTIIKDNPGSAPPLFIGTDLRIGGGVKDKWNVIPYDFSFGFKFGIDFTGFGQRECNYTNHPGTEERGYGAALTEYMIYLGDVNYGLFAKAKLFDVGFVEYDIELPIFQGVLLRNGWDRYDRFQDNQGYSSNVPTLNHTIKGGVEFSFPTESYEYGLNKKKLSIFAGVKIPQNVFATSSNEFGITYSPSFFGGIQYTQAMEVPDFD